MNRMNFTAHILMIVVGLSLPCFIHSSALGGLYECTDGSGSLIFTDRPAQLQRCKPLSATQSSSSPQATPMPPVPMPYQNALPATIDPPPAPFTAPLDHSMAQGSQTVQQPCTPGVNPLNPLAAPPCHQIPAQPNAVPQLQ
jgi:uncharacterized protein DUF4124